MHKRTQIKQSKKRQSVQEALSIIEPLFAHVLNSTIETQTSVIMSTYEFSHDLSVISGDEVRKTIVDDCNVEINWDSIPSSINPSHGELDEIRSKRKRDQLQSMIGYIEPELNRLLKVYSEEFNETNNCSGSSSAKKVTVVEFGSGSGHLSLVLAHRHPLIHFILVERKEYTISVARHRVSECGLQNVSMFTGELSDLDSFLNGRQISLGIGLHCCGLFTDMALDVCLSHNASFVISPCCYGQIGRPPVSTLPSALDDDSKTLECILHSRSNRIFKLHPDQLRPISSTADWIYNFLDSDSVLLSDQDVLSQPNFLLAKRCMMAVDVDRLCRVCEHSESQLEVRSECDSESQITRIGGRYFCRVDSLRPLACTPKNNVIIGRFVSS